MQIGGPTLTANGVGPPPRHSTQLAKSAKVRDVIVELCECGWGIPRVDRLPPHTHGSWALVDLNGQRLRIHQHDLALNPGLHVVDRWEDINIWIDWRRMARMSSGAS